MRTYRLLHPAESPIKAVLIVAALLALLCGATACAGPAAPATVTPDPRTPTVTPAPVVVPPSPIPTATPVPASPTVSASPSATPSATATPAPPPKVPVLAYHMVGIPEGGDYNVSVEQFEEEMQWLHDNDYHTITPAQLLDAIREGAPLPPRPVIITFDDNQISPYLHAVPILKRFGFTASFFIMTVTIGKDGYMDADQIKDLADEGFTIGGHTWDHRILTQQIDSEVERQLDLSGADLRAILGHDPEYFAYPSGLYDQHIVDALKAHGYKMAFRLFSDDDPPVDPAFMVRRQIIPGGWPRDYFVPRVHWM